MIRNSLVNLWRPIQRKMCVIEGIESVIDDGRSPHNLFLTRIYGLFYFETCVIDDKRVRLRTDAYKHIWFDLIHTKGV